MKIKVTSADENVSFKITTDDYSVAGELLRIMLIDYNNLSVRINGHYFKISVEPAIGGYGYDATTTDYNGAGDKINHAHSLVSPQQAFTDLIEKIDEAINENKI